MTDRRKIVDRMVARGVPKNRGSAYAALARSTYNYKSGNEEKARRDEELLARMRKLALKHRRFGYPRITAMLRRAGIVVNRKRVYRIWRDSGLALVKKRPRKRKSGLFSKAIKRARYRNHIWAYDFAFDRLESGVQLKFLDIIDEFTRLRIALWPARNIGAREVIVVLEEAFRKYGTPKYIRSDNGSEFIARELAQWLKSRGAKTMHITPGHPWENPFSESGIGKSRDEFLNEEIFRSEREAQILAEKWRRYYNERRPHMSLNYMTPIEFARAREKSHGKKVLQ